MDNDYVRMKRRFIMKYKKEERMGILSRIYDGEISQYKATVEYGIIDRALN